MEIKQYIMMAVGLIVGVLLIAGVVAPVISDVSSDDDGAGETYSNPAPYLRYAYAEGTIPDFSIDFSMTQSSITIGEQEYAPDLSGIDPTDPDSVSVAYVMVYADESKTLMQVEGYGLLVVQDGSANVVIAGMSGNITCASGTISVVTDIVSTPYTFDAPSWCYYADPDGDYGRYDVYDIRDGIYVDDSPICAYGFLDDDSERIQVYNDGYHTSDPHAVPRTLEQHKSVDGNSLTGLTWTVGDKTVKAMVLIAPIEITEGSGSGGGSGLSPTLKTMLSVIPLILTVGLVIGAIGYLRFKER